MSPGKPKILVVEDDVRMLRLEERILEAEGYRVITATDGQTALDIFEEENPDLTLVDVMIPGPDGYEVCQRIREFSRVPVIMVTAKGAEEEKLKGFDVGADDYVTKPFRMGELVARVKAVLRRTMMGGAMAGPAFRYGDLVVDFARNRVTVAGEEVMLTATEYYLLSYLARHAGYVLTTNEILRNVWGEGYEDDAALVQVTISRLRQKLRDDARNPKYIVTRPGIGYSMKK